MSKFSSTFALCFFSYFVLPALSLSFCNINPNNDLNENHPLLLRQNSEEFYYPNKCNTNRMKLRFCETIRAVCPQDNLQVYNRNLNRAEADLKCYAANFFRVGSAFFGAPLKNIACTSAPVATLTNTGTTCPNGVIGRIGFELQNNKWANTIDRICHNEAIGQTHWAHHRVPGAIRSRQSSNSNEAPAFMTGPFYTNIPMNSSLFTRDSQRARLLELLMNQTDVDRIIPPTSSNILTTGMLTPPGDMFYREQQDSTYYYANTLPVWSSIRDGNWKQVEGIVRRVAKRSCRTLDVYSGGIGVLSYNNSAGNLTDFTLTTTMNDSANTTATPAVPVPRYLFRYVIDRSRNQGLAFITVNDPMVTNPPPASDILCEEYAECSSKFPEFKTPMRGYTYCCTVGQGNGFSMRAMDLGLPTFPNAKPLSLNAATDNGNALNPLLQAILPDVILENIGAALPTSSTPRPAGLFFDAGDSVDDDDDFDF